MIKAVSLSDNKVNFRQNAESDKKQSMDEESKILPNTLQTRINQKFDKTLSALTEYPAKGLKGDVNSDFYEFLSMGMIPYLTGSAMFMGLFNLVNKHLVDPKSRVIAAEKGKKMALGVVLYGLGKTLSNDLVTKPVSLATGVDIDLPYRNVYYPLPTKPGAEAEIFPQHQQRKVYDSSEFFRKDLLAKDPEYGVEYYNKIARKLGLGDDLNDSVTETTPIIQNIISTTKTAKTLSSYAWAGLGVGLAMQNSWSDFFKTISNRRKHIPMPNEGLGTKIGSKLSNMGKNSIDITKAFGRSFINACRTLWTGEPGTKGYLKHAGKAGIIFTLGLTGFGIANVIYRAKQMGKLRNKDLIDKNKESTVI